MLDSSSKQICIIYTATAFVNPDHRLSTLLSAVQACVQHHAYSLKVRRRMNLISAPTNALMFLPEETTRIFHEECERPYVGNI